MTELLFILLLAATSVTGWAAERRRTIQLRRSRRALAEFQRTSRAAELRLRDQMRELQARRMFDQTERHR